MDQYPSGSVGTVLEIVERSDSDAGTSVHHRTRSKTAIHR